MREALTLSTWNSKGAFSDAQRAESALEAITTAKPTIIALPDAWHEDSEHSTPTARNRLITDAAIEATAYYPLAATFQEDRPDDNYGRYGFLTLVETTAPVVDTEEIRLGRRPAHLIHLLLGKQALTVASLYLNDQSETNRIEQTAQLLEYLEKYSEQPVVLMGDFNAMHGEAVVARALRSQLVRTSLGKLSIANNTLPRLIDMASGDTLAALKAAGFQDAEPYHSPTIPSQLPLFQLDHIMIRDPENKFTIGRPTRINRRSLSDHVQLQTTLTVNQ